MDDARREAYFDLKVKLGREQAMPIPRIGYCVVCPMCLHQQLPYREFGRPTNAHHFLVKRNRVQMWPEEQRGLIDAPENLVILCARCDAQFDRLSSTTEVLIQYKLNKGYDLLKWLDSLPFKQAPEDLRRLVINGIHQHQQTSRQDLVERAGDGSVRDRGSDN